MWGAGTLAVVAVCFVVLVNDGAARWLTVRELDLLDGLENLRHAWLTDLARFVQDSVGWVTAVAGWAAIVVSLWWRRVRQLLVLLAGLLAVAAISLGIARTVARPRPFGLELLGEWVGFSHPSRPIALLVAALVGAVLTTVPDGRLRRRVWVGVAAVVVVAGLAELYLGVSYLTDVLAAIAIGTAVPILLHRAIAPERVFPVRYRRGRSAHVDLDDERVDAIVTGVDHQLGLAVSEVRTHGLEGSAGSTPLELRTADGQRLFAKLYARSHLRADRYYKLWRRLLYGRLEDEYHFTSLRRFVQYEDYMLLLMAANEIPVPRTHGIVELTPEREYVLVGEFLEGAVEIGSAPVDVPLIDEALGMVRRLWNAGLAHRDIKPANVMVHDGHIRLIDVAFAEVLPSPWRQAVDLADMLLVLALRSDPDVVWERAGLQFTADELGEAVASARGVTLPSQLRTELRRDGRSLLERFKELAPRHEPIRLQRWSVARVVSLLAGVAVAVAGASLVAANADNIGLVPW